MEEPCECESVISRMEWAQWVGENFTKHFCGYLGPLALFCLQENRESSSKVLMQDENNVETSPIFQTPSPFRSAFLSQGLVALKGNFC